MKKIAIIGAGFTGAYLASQLKEAYQVSVFEKARGIGGRMATRYHTFYEFDHGAPYFSVQHPDFQTYVEDAIEKNLVAHCPSSEQYVSTPRMNHWIKSMLNDVDVHIGTPITNIEFHLQWTLSTTEKKFTGFDFLICTAPAQQTQKLLPKEVAFYDALSSLGLKPQLVLMLGLKTSWQKNIKDMHIIEKIIDNRLKPNRQKIAPSYVIYADKHWSQNHLEDDLQALETLFLDNLQLNPQDVEYFAIHRWRYAQTSHSLKNPLVLMDSKMNCAACGDWCFNGDVESAFLSANALLKDFNF